MVFITTHGIVRKFVINSLIPLYPHFFKKIDAMGLKISFTVDGRHADHILNLKYSVVH